MQKQCPEVGVSPTILRDKKDLGHHGEGEESGNMLDRQTDKNQTVEGILF
jgi:hypothetical protein